MMKIKHVKWEMSEGVSDMECTYTQDSIISYRFKMDANNDIVSLKTKEKYSPLKFKKKEYKDALGINVIESAGIYEINEGELT